MKQNVNVNDKEHLYRSYHIYMEFGVQFKLTQQIRYGSDEIFAKIICNH